VSAMLRWRRRVWHGSRLACGGTRLRVRRNGERK
jgi:hypothetical protein